MALTLPQPNISQASQSLIERDKKGERGRERETERGKPPLSFANALPPPRRSATFPSPNFWCPFFSPSPQKHFFFVFKKFQIDGDISRYASSGFAFGLYLWSLPHSFHLIINFVFSILILLLFKMLHFDLHCSDRALKFQMFLSRVLNYGCFRYFFFL